MNCCFDEGAPLVMLAVSNTSDEDAKEINGVVSHHEIFSPTKLLIVVRIEKKGDLAQRLDFTQDFCFIIKKKFITEIIDIRWYLEIKVKPTEINEYSPTHCNSQGTIRKHTSRVMKHKSCILWLKRARNPSRFEIKKYQNYEKTNILLPFYLI